MVDKFPEAYPKDPDTENELGYYSFNPSGMTIYLMKAIKELKEEISAADYEAAAISAAIAMEKNAIRLYSDRASDAADPNEKALYKWLAEWERQHLNFLAEIDKELTEKIWYDNNFWPF